MFLPQFKDSWFRFTHKTYIIHILLQPYKLHLNGNHISLDIYISKIDYIRILHRILPGSININYRSHIFERFSYSSLSEYHVANTPTAY